MKACLARRHSTLGGVLLAMVAFYIGCGNGRTATNEVKLYQYAIPEKVNDGWETASLKDARMDADLVRALFERILANGYKNISSVTCASSVFQQS